MTKRFWIITGISALIVFLTAFLFYVWRPVLKNKNLSVELKKDAFAPRTTYEPAGNSQSSFGVPKETAIKPFFQQEKEKISDAFLRPFYPLTDSFVSESDFPPQKEQTFLSFSNSTKPRHVLTDEEWFKIAYPDFYIKYLTTMESFMRNDGFISESEKFELASEKGINLLLHRIIDFYLKKELINNAQANGFRKGIDTILPELHNAERSILEGKISLFTPDIKIIKTAYAVNLEIECYQIGATTPLGSNVVVPTCCNCGWRYCGTTICYLHDCGEYGVLCDIPNGCLNALCRGQSAIWDPMTGICGC